MAVIEKRRLARGLDALLGGGFEEEGARPATTNVPLAQIERNPYQPRKEFDAQELAALRDSLTTHGLLQPIVVRPLDAGYQLIAGERRFRAAQEAGWKDIPVRVIDLNDRQTFEAAMVENLQRSDLNPIEKAQGFQDYVKQYRVTHEELAQRMGLDRTTITNLLRLLELPAEVQEAVRTNQISNGHAKALLALEDEGQQLSLCREIVAKGLSVRATEALVRPTQTSAADGKVAQPEPKKTAHVLAIEEELRKKLATKVEIRQRSDDQGQIVLSFESNDDFERLLEVLRG